MFHKRHHNCMRLFYRVGHKVLSHYKNEESYLEKKYIYFWESTFKSCFNRFLKSYQTNGSHLWQYIVEDIPGNSLSLSGSSLGWNSVDFLSDFLKVRG